MAGADAVFANCQERKLTLPAAASSPNALLHADRDYHIASAYFDNGDFAESEKRFRRIMGDAQSPRQPIARYLAARSLTRSANLADVKPDLALLGKANQELEAVLADPGGRTPPGSPSRASRLSGPPHLAARGAPGR